MISKKTLAVTALALLLSHIVERNKYNDSYMETKFGKLGHRLRVF